MRGLNTPRTSILPKTRDGNKEATRSTRAAIWNIMPHQQVSLPDCVGLAGARPSSGTAVGSARIRS